MNRVSADNDMTHSSFPMSPENVMEGMLLKGFNLYENGTLVITTQSDAQVVMQFNTKQIAQDWLIEHFDKLKYGTSTVQ